MDLHPRGPISQMECRASGLAFLGHDERWRDESGEQIPRGERENLEGLGNKQSGQDHASRLNR